MVSNDLCIHLYICKHCAPNNLSLSPSLSLFVFIFLPFYRSMYLSIVNPSIYPFLSLPLSLSLSIYLSFLLFSAPPPPFFFPPSLFLIFFPFKVHLNPSRDLRELSSAYHSRHHKFGCRYLGRNGPATRSGRWNERLLFCMGLGE